MFIIFNLNKKKTKNAKNLYNAKIGNGRKCGYNVTSDHLILESCACSAFIDTCMGTSVSHKDPLISMLKVFHKNAQDKSKIKVR